MVDVEVEEDVEGDMAEVVEESEEEKDVRMRNITDFDSQPAMAI